MQKKFIIKNHENIDRWWSDSLLNQKLKNLQIYMPEILKIRLLN